MNTTQLVNNVAKTTGLTKVQAKAVVTTIFSNIKTAVKKGQTVAINDFGSYKIVKRKARNGINPSTKEKIKIPARKVVKFSASKALKTLVK
jgi:DNA-binding protein HU-beta